MAGGGNGYAFVAMLDWYTLFYSLIFMFGLYSYIYKLGVDLCAVDLLHG